MPGLDWLIARPVAHRGLHDAAAGVIENTPSAVVAAAVAGNTRSRSTCRSPPTARRWCITTRTLGRLTEGDGRLDAMSAAELKSVRFKATADRMMTLGDLLDLVAGRVALVLELKSRFDGDTRLPRRVAEVVRSLCGTGRRDVVRSLAGRGDPGLRARAAARHRGARPSRAAIMPDHDAARTSWPISCRASAAGRISSPIM